MTGKLIHCFEIFTGIKEDRTNHNITWYQANARCTSTIELIVLRYKPNVDSQWKYFEKQMMKSINDEAYYFRESEYRRIFALCEYINNVNISESNNHIWIIAAEECNKQINNTSDNSYDSIQYDSWPRILDLVRNINNKQAYKTENSGWKLCQRYVSYINKENKSDIWQQALRNFHYYYKAERQNSR